MHAAATVVHPVSLPFPLPKLMGDLAKDSFNNDAPGATPSSWTVNNGGSMSASLGIASLTSNGAANVSATLPLTGSSLFVEALGQIGTASSAQIVSRWQSGTNGGNSYNAFFTTTACGIGKSVNGTFTSFGSNAIVASASDFHRLGFRAVGPNLTVFFDGRAIFSASDTTFASGIVGLWAFSGTNKWRWFRAVAL